MVTVADNTHDTHIEDTIYSKPGVIPGNFFMTGGHYDIDADTVYTYRDGYRIGSVAHDIFCVAGGDYRVIYGVDNGFEELLYKKIRGIDLAGN